MWGSVTDQNGGEPGPNTNVAMKLTGFIKGLPLSVWLISLTCVHSIPWKAFLDPPAFKIQVRHIPFVLTLTTVTCFKAEVARLLDSASEKTYFSMQKYIQVWVKLQQQPLKAAAHVLFFPTGIASSQYEKSQVLADHPVVNSVFCLLTFPEEAHGTGKGSLVCKEGWHRGFSSPDLFHEIDLWDWG